MANHSIDVRLTQQGNGGQNENLVRSGKKTSALSQFTNKSATSRGLGGNVVKGIRTIRTFNVTSTLGAFGGATIPTAIAQEIVRGAKRVVDIYASVQIAKTGEKMQWRNNKQLMNVVANPIGFMKSAVWENGYLRNLEIARENVMLEYNRQLTGDLIYSKNTQHNIL